jgi:4-hydroxybenzoate polyprenyltransferase
VTSFRDLVELVRAPAALTVPGDTLAGATAGGWPGGWPGGRRTALLPIASTCLYWAGMALNDYADRDLDRVERPERPIPSGRVSPGLALGVATALTAGGVATAAVAGGAKSAATASVLAALIWGYDLSAKTGPISVAAMAGTRGLDVLMGASPGGVPALRRALPAAALVTAHTAGVTALSRGEVHGTSSTTARRVAVVSGLVAAASALRPTGAGAFSRAVSIGAAALYASQAVRAQAEAVRNPDGPTVRRATGSGIRAIVPLQAAQVAASGRPVLGAALTASLPLGRAAMRRVSPT